MRTALVLVMVFLVGGLIFADDLGFQGAARILIMPDGGNLDPYLELKSDAPGPSSFLGYSSITGGLYYRIITNLKLGVFYRLQFGALHNEDWLHSGTWFWRDTSARPEQVLIADVSPRFLLGFNSDASWVISFKARYLYNLYNGNQSLYLRPGFNYTAFKSRQAVWGLGLYYAAGLGLNFGDDPFYSNEVYLNGIYHLSSTVKIQPQLSWSRKSYSGYTWGTNFAFSEQKLLFELALIYLPKLPF